MKSKNVQLVIAIFTPFISLVSSSSSFNVYNYDLNTPVFTPDGELKQVEYAAEASSHSYPMIIVPCALNGDKTLIIMATRNKPQRAQSRIIEMPISHGAQNSGEASLLFGVNGILSDCVSLLQTAREEIQSIQRSYGAPSMSFALVSSSSRPPLHSVKCAKKVALAIADKCQQHSFGGGIRPFGAEIAICGMDNAGNIAIFVTEPSGSVLEFTSHANDGGYVIGGDSRKREELKLALQSKETSSTDHNELKDDSDGMKIREQIHQAINAFIQVYKDEEVGENRGDKTAQEIILDEIDLVMTHSSKGVFRMTGKMLKNVMEKHAVSATKD
jgi:20S proteasome alpha/beta subunit